MHDGGVFCKHLLDPAPSPARTIPLNQPAQSRELKPALEPPTRVRFQVLAAACSVAVITYIHRIGFASASTELKDQLRLDSTQLGYLMAAFLVAYAIFEIPGGLLADRFGARHLLTLLVLGWSFLTGAVALVLVLPAVWALQYGFLLIARFLFGAAQAGGFPTLSRMLTDWMPLRQRGTAKGFLWMSARLGGALAPLLFGLLVGGVGAFQGFGWATSLCVLAALGGVWCAVFWPWFRNRPEEMPTCNEAERNLIVAGRPARTAGRLSAGRLLRSRSVWGLCLMYGFEGFGATMFVTVLPDYLKNYRHCTTEQTHLLTSLPLACGVVACALGGYLSDLFIRGTGSRKWGRRVNGAIGLALAGVTSLATPYVNGVEALGVLLCATFFCNDLNMGPAWAACADVGERYAGTVGGSMNMVGNLFAAGMAALAGWLLQAGDVPFVFAGREVLGRDLVFFLFGASYFCSALCWLLVDASRPLAIELAETDR